MAGKKSKAIAASAEITSDEEEMRDAIREIRAAGVNVCFVSMGAEEMDIFFKNAEDMGLSGVTFLGTRSWGDEAFISMMKKHRGIKVVFPYETVLSQTGVDTDDQSEEGQKFRIEYANRYGDANIPTDNAALGYDSYLLLINAIHNAKSLDGPAIREAMRNFDGLKCATGVFSFDNTGNVVRAVTLATIKDNKAVLEYTTNTEAQAKKLEDLESSTGSN
jgi:branched-chain amino acid transport system substrate-binding protein